MHIFSSSLLSFCKTVSSRFFLFFFSTTQWICLDDDFFFSLLSRRVDFSYISSINKFYDDDCIWKKIMFSSLALSLSLSPFHLAIEVKGKNEASRCFTFPSRWITTFLLSEFWLFAREKERKDIFGVIVNDERKPSFFNWRLCVFAYFYVLILPVMLIYASVVENATQFQNVRST